MLLASGPKFCSQGSIYNFNSIKNSKVNQVIYTTGSIFLQKIMLLASGVLEIFCSQGSIGLQCTKSKKGHNSIKNSRFFSKVNQVIYTTGILILQNLMILASGVLEIFCSQGSIGLQCTKSKKGHNSIKNSRICFKS